MRVLVDTSALLALSRKRDQDHARAVGIAERHLVLGGRFVGTTLVLGELHAHLLHLRGVKGARVALTSLLDDPLHEWVEVAADLVLDAETHWLARFAGQPFTLVDAVSFEVMQRQKLTHAFAFDRHFELAGFASLR